MIVEAVFIFAMLILTGACALIVYALHTDGRPGRKVESMEPCVQDTPREYIKPSGEFWGYVSYEQQQAAMADRQRKQDDALYERGVKVRCRGCQTLAFRWKVGSGRETLYFVQTKAGEVIELEFGK